jgi:GT2 family glycosyltransferase
VIEKTKDVSYQIILVDNASTECDPKKFKEQYPQINLIASEVNLGFSKGNNLGISHADGEYILLLNSDTELIEDSVSICYKKIFANKNIGALTCKLIYPNGKVQHNCQSFPSIFKTYFEKLRLHKLFSNKNNGKLLQGFYWDYDSFGYPDWIWGTFFMIKKECLSFMPEKKLNEDFFMYVEDTQWCWDFQKIGMKVAYVSDTTVIHFGGGSMGNFNDLIMKNYKIFLDKNYGYIQKRLINLTIF